MREQILNHLILIDVLRSLRHFRHGGEASGIHGCDVVLVIPCDFRFRCWTAFTQGDVTTCRVLIVRKCGVPLLLLLDHESSPS